VRDLTEIQSHDIFIQYSDLLSEQLSSDEHISLIPDLTSLVEDYGLDFAMAFQIIRPRLYAELERAKDEDKAAVQKRLLAERQALEARINSPSKEETPLPSSPKVEGMQMDEEVQEAVLEDAGEGKEVPKTADVSSVPPPKFAAVRVS
jgi:THO complex subunit 2